MNYAINVSHVDARKQRRGGWLKAVELKRLAAENQRFDVWMAFNKKNAPNVRYSKIFQNFQN